MKILYITDYGKFNGGASISLLLLAEEMSNRWHEVYVLSPESNQIPQKKGIKFITIEEIRIEFPFIFRNPIAAIKMVKKIHKYITNINPDLIHVHFPRAARAIGMGRKLGWYKSQPIIYTEREFVSGLSKIYQILYKVLVAKQFDGIVCLTNKASTFWYKYRSNNIYVIPNAGGAVFDKYEEDNCKSAHIKIKTNNEKVKLFFAGRFDPIKRWDLALEIIKELLEKEENRFDIYIAISSGESELGYEDFIKTLNNNHQIHIYENANWSTMSDLYYISDIHIITSRMESFGRTAIEAMSRKTLVLSTNAGAVGEVIGDKKYIIPAESKSFVEKIIWYADHPDVLEKEREAMFKRYQENYTTEENTRRHLLAYSELLDKKNSCYIVKP